MSVAFEETAFQMILISALSSIFNKSSGKVPEWVDDRLQPSLFSDVDISDPPYKPMCNALPNGMGRQWCATCNAYTAHKPKNVLKNKKQ